MADFQRDNLDESPAAAGRSAPDASRPAGQPGGVRGFLRGVRDLTREMVAIARGQPVEPPEEDDAQSPLAQSPPPEKAGWKVNVLHAATERLRGAADEYIAAKLDEIEARVDAKLGEIERRIDEKMLDLHRQLRQARDRELRHRLRLLKITLLFTVLVAILSLGYKLVIKYWVG